MTPLQYAQLERKSTQQIKLDIAVLENMLDICKRELEKREIENE